MSRVKPEFWSDLDGTGLAKRHLVHPFNWSKYPLAAMPGYKDFVRGVGEAGVSLGGIVSVRPNIWPRRMVTRWSMQQHGYDRLFPDPAQTVLAGSEAAKAELIVQRSQGGPVGMIDDKPHLIGIELMAAMLEQPGSYPILLGAVNHRQSKLRYDELSAKATWADWFGRHSREICIEQLTDTKGPFESGMSVHVGSAALHIVQLPEYSFEAGQAFGGMMQQVAA